MSINVELVGGSAGQPVNVQINDPSGNPIFLQTILGILIYSL